MNKLIKAALLKQGSPAFYVVSQIYNLLNSNYITLKPNL